MNTCNDKSTKYKVGLFSIVTLFMVFLSFINFDEFINPKEIIIACVFFGLFNIISTIKYKYNEKKVDIIAILNSVSTIAILYILLKSFIPNVNSRLLIPSITLFVWLINFFILNNKYKDYLVKSFLNNSIACFISMLLFIPVMKYDNHSSLIFFILVFVYIGLYISSKSKSENDSLKGAFFFIPALLYVTSVESYKSVIYVIITLFCTPSINLIAYKLVNHERSENQISVFAPMLMLSFITSYFVLYSKGHEVLSFYYGVLFLIIPIILIYYTVKNCEYYKPSLSIWFFSLILSIVFMISMYLIIKYFPYVFISARELNYFIMNDTYRLLSSYSNVMTVGFLIYFPILVKIINRFGIKKN